MRYQNTDEIAIPAIARYYLNGKAIYEAENGQLFYVPTRADLFEPNTLEDASVLLPRHTLPTSEQAELRRLQEWQNHFASTPLRVLAFVDDDCVLVCTNAPGATIVQMELTDLQLLDAADIAQISITDMAHRPITNPLQGVKTSAGFVLY